jgi:hypothetical protein
MAQDASGLCASWFQAKLRGQFKAAISDCSWHVYPSESSACVERNAAALTIDTTGGQPKPKARMAELNQADRPTEYRRFHEGLTHGILDAACLTGCRLRCSAIG